VVTVPFVHAPYHRVFTDAELIEGDTLSQEFSARASP
jgi:hypothetical protein